MTQTQPKDTVHVLCWVRFMQEIPTLNSAPITLHSGRDGYLLYSKHLHFMACFFCLVPFFFVDLAAILFFSRGKGVRVGGRPQPLPRLRRRRRRDGGARKLRLLLRPGADVLRRGCARDDPQDEGSAAVRAAVGDGTAHARPRRAGEDAGGRPGICIYIACAVNAMFNVERASAVFHIPVAMHARVWVRRGSGGGGELIVSIYGTILFIVGTVDVIFFLFYESCYCLRVIYDTRWLSMLHWFRLLSW